MPLPARYVVETRVFYPSVGLTRTTARRNFKSRSMAISYCRGLAKRDPHHRVIDGRAPSTTYRVWDADENMTAWTADVR